MYVIILLLSTYTVEPSSVSGSLPRNKLQQTQGGFDSISLLPTELRANHKDGTCSHLFIFKTQQFTNGLVSKEFEFQWGCALHKPAVIIHFTERSFTWLLSMENELIGSSHELRIGSILLPKSKRESLKRREPTFIGHGLGIRCPASSIAMSFSSVSSNWRQSSPVCWWIQV